LGGSPEGQMIAGELNIVQERNVKGAGAGHPYVPKNEPAGKTNLAE